MASAAGLMNFLRTLSGAFATSIVTTAWESKTTTMHAELAGLVDSTGDALRSLGGSGLGAESSRSLLDSLAQGQSVMLATNGILWEVALVFGLAACVIWLAPKPERAIDLSQVGH